MFVCNVPNGLGCGDGEFTRINVDKCVAIRNRCTKLSNLPARRLAQRRNDCNLSARKYHSKCVPSCKKAKSMENLATNQQLNILRSKSLLAITSAKENLPMASTVTDMKEVHAARRIYQALLLNAWRRRRLQVVHLSDNVDNLKQQKENFHLHMAFLRTLLETERKRVTQFNTAAQQMALEAQEMKSQREQVTKEKKLLEKEIEHLEETLEDLNTKCNNYKNDLLASRTEFSLVETQLTKEREKLAKLREDKNILIQKLQATEDEATEKDGVIESLQQSKASLEHRLYTETQMLQLAEAENQDTQRTMQQLREKLELELQQVRMEQHSLEKRLEEGEALLADKEKECVSLRASLQGHQLEMRHMEERIIQQTQANGESWRERTLMYFARLPLSLFRGAVGAIISSTTV